MIIVPRVHELIGSALAMCAGRTASLPGLDTHIWGAHLYRASGAQEYCVVKGGGE